MLCGFCGTEVKEGYVTCASCGATYMAKPRAPNGLIAIMCFIFAAFGAVTIWLGLKGGAGPNFSDNVGAVLGGIAIIAVCYGIIRLCFGPGKPMWYR